MRAYTTLLKIKVLTSSRQAHLIELVVLLLAKQILISTLKLVFNII